MILTLLGMLTCSVLALSGSWKAIFQPTNLVCGTGYKTLVDGKKADWLLSTCPCPVGCCLLDYPHSTPQSTYALHRLKFLSQFSYSCQSRVQSTPHLWWNGVWGVAECGRWVTYCGCYCTERCEAFSTLLLHGQQSWLTPFHERPVCRH